MTTIDGITRAVIVNNLQWITEEMNQYLVKSAYSVNIKYRRDCSCAVYTKNGDMLAQGTFIPVHLGVMAQTLKELLKVHPADTLEQGDVLLHNDPYMMGSHMWDMMVFKPIFHQGGLIAFTGCLAHQSDVGGSPLRYILRTIYEEGLRISGVKLMRKGVLQEDIIRLITTNVRNSYEVNGDIMAELAANNRGEMRLQALAEKYGKEGLTKYFEAILDYSETGMRQAIGDLPDGEYTFEDYVESDGINDVMLKLKVKVIISGSDVYLDFDGSAPPAEGGYNNPMGLTYSAVYYAVKSIVGTEVPANGGAYRSIHVIKPSEPSILDAQPPHAVGGCTTVCPQRIVDIIIGAFAGIAEKKVCACDGHWSAASFVGMNPKTNRWFVYGETYGCGRGAKYNEDGANGHQTHMTNTLNTPTEIIELMYPFQVNRYALVNDSGGAGRYRGGLAIVRELLCLTDVNASIISGRPTIKPYGLKGGEGGQHDMHLVKFPNGEQRAVRSERLPGGSVVVVQTSGGGGWGNPALRDREALEWDVLNGYVSLESAGEKYGCTIDPVTMKIVD